MRISSPVDFSRAVIERVESKIIERQTTQIDENINDVSTRYLFTLHDIAENKYSIQ